ncbi:hypothetical protein CTI12_AA112260 [Artemisia annua]|uniref:KIB1-4 beta-propeller domain-containing protein n=1 Tax=Artemisia annua TaxID=35608 RepID=A0A2U1PU91_ARTAN|nr:hypothetical protein CTI12_AA112260 [Artemisia annua]
MAIANNFQPCFWLVFHGSSPTGVSDSGAMKQISGSLVCNQFPPLSAKYPWLVAQYLEGEGHNTEDQFFYTIHNELPYYQCRIPELLEKRIQGYFHGWLKRLTSNGKLVHSLTCCNGKVYALSTDGTFAHFIIQVDIIVKYKEVVIKLMIFGSIPFPSSGRCGNNIQYLKGSSTELFYIDIYFERETKKIPADVYLFKTDMACINWEERVWFKDWDITNIRYPGCDNLQGSSSEDSETISEILDKLDISCEIWEEINDLKDAIFFIDLARDRLVSYSRVITSDLGGFIHIRGEMGETIYSYHLKRLTSNGKLVHSLTCCNGKVYALSTDSTFAHFIIQVDIIVKYKEVVIKLMIFGSIPFPSSGRCGNNIQYLKGSSTELFYIDIYFERETKKIPADVYLFKTDMACINWEERVWFKDWDITNIRYPGCDNLQGSSSEDSETISEILDKLDISCEIWEEINDLKDAIFFIDLARDRLVSYSRVITSDLGGFIHIRGEMGETIYSYHVKNDTISVYHIPSPMLPTTQAMCQCGNTGTDDGDEFKESHLLNISFHLLEMIMELCVGVEYMSFRATCKQCLLAAPLIKWSNETSLRRLHTYSLASPWLMVVDRKRGNMTFTDPMLGDNYYLKNSKVLIYQSEQICCSRFGWLLFNKKDLGCLVFFNPFTNDLRELPEAEHNLGSLCFSAPPTSLDCMVVGFKREHVYIHFVNQETKWRTLSLATEPHSVCFSTFYGRDLYALCKQGELMVMNNLGTEDYASKLVEAEDPKSYCEPSTQYFFTKCDQHCLLVGVGEYGKVIKVFKCNESKQAWEKVDSVGKHVIYICGTTCLCIEAKEPKMENKIFFPRLHTKNRKVVFYSLDTCSYHTFNGANFQDHLVDFFGTTYDLSHNLVSRSSTCLIDSQASFLSEDKGIESIEALSTLYDCIVARHIWLRFWKWWGISDPSQFSRKDVSARSLIPMESKSMVKALQGVFYILMWSIWKWRERLVHASVERDAILLEVIFPQIQQLSLLWISNQCGIFNLNW